VISFEVHAVVVQVFQHDLRLEIAGNLSGVSLIDYHRRFDLGTGDTVHLSALRNATRTWRGDFRRNF